MSDFDLSALSFDIASLHAAYAAGLPAADAMAESFARIAATGDPAIFLHLRAPDEVAAEAAGLPPFDPDRYPLWGLPFAVKDNIDVAGVPTTAACPMFAYVAEDDAFVVGLLRKAGAIWIGKANLDQFATGLVGTRSPYGVPKNAIDPEIVPGGSSSGSGVAVARGIVSFALGTDTAGSGRVPAALNNIVGLKPTLGALSSSGLVPACRSLDTISVFALTVPDAWQVFRAVCCYDAADAFSRPLAAPVLSATPPSLRVAIPDGETRPFFGDEAQQTSFDAAVATLKDIGCSVSEIDFTPFFEVARMLYEGPWIAERMAAVEEFFRADAEAFHPVTARIIGAADTFSAADAFRGIYRLAALKRAAADAMASFDLLCVPTIPTFVTLEEIASDPIGPNSRLGTYTNFVNLLDLCGIAVPTGPRSDGRPGSVTFLARAGQDALLAALGTEIHERVGTTLGATLHPVPRLPAAKPMAHSDELALALVGAHMSGLPLNHEIRDRGGRFLAEARTAALYSLHALAGGPPERPALVRVNEGGTAIALEVWALPRREVGDLLAEVPAPLGFGKVELSDGSHVTGFLGEAAGLLGATDITHFGGWRAYLAARG